MKNCMYHIVENQNSDDIERIIDNLFNRMDFGEKENYRYTKDYLEAEKVLKKEETLFKKFEEAKVNEAENLKKKFSDTKQFPLSASDESPFKVYFK